MKVQTILIIVFLLACQSKSNKSNIKRNSPNSFEYEMKELQNWLIKNADIPHHIKIATSVNRTDSMHLAKMDSIIIPKDIYGDIEFYLHFPLYVKYINNINKIIYFSYATQTFGAYEKGHLIYSGTCNMGKKTSLTPLGLFFTNWKAKKTISTFNDEWDLYWNFNIQNKEGIGWHQYNLPGYPASSSCLRLQESDAKFLYNWAEQWVLSDYINIQIKGTPVIIFGIYDFNKPKPWLELINKPKALNHSEKQIKRETIEFYNHIIFEQIKREDYQDSIKLSI
jgi:hypothetical protein